MADRQKPKPESAKDKKPHTKTDARKERNREANKARYELNTHLVAEAGLAPEDTIRIIHKVQRVNVPNSKRKKVIITEQTVVKKKRPSKLLRKYRRRELTQKGS